MYREGPFWVFTKLTIINKCEARKAIKQAVSGKKAQISGWGNGYKTYSQLISYGCMKGYEKGYSI
jgi:hypothetical protein